LLEFIFMTHSSHNSMVQVRNQVEALWSALVSNESRHHHPGHHPINSTEHHASNQARTQLINDSAANIRAVLDRLQSMFSNL
jgi:hypothetical protein